MIKKVKFCSGEERKGGKEKRGNLAAAPCEIDDGLGAVEPRFVYR
jgi:hypothetical protein